MTWTTGLSTPAGLVANARSRVAFLVRFKVDDDYDVASVGGGVGGGELDGVAICLQRKKHYLINIIKKTVIGYVNEWTQIIARIIKKLH